MGPAAALAGRRSPLRVLAPVVFFALADEQEDERDERDPGDPEQHRGRDVPAVPLAAARTATPAISVSVPTPIATRFSTGIAARRGDFGAGVPDTPGTLPRVAAAFTPVTSPGLAAARPGAARPSDRALRRA